MSDGRLSANDTARFYSIDAHVETLGDVVKIGMSVWCGTPILRPYTDLPNYDLYRIRVHMDGITHFAINDHEYWGDKKVRRVFTHWLRSGRNKDMQGLLNE